MDRGVDKNTALSNMNRETLDYFIAGLRVAIRNMGIPQEDFAKGVTTPSNISRILNKNVGTSAEMRQKLAERAGMEISDIVLLGKNEVNSEDDNYTEFSGDPVDLLDEVSRAYRKERNEARYWRSCFDSLAIPVCIVDQDGIICYQNQADRSLYQADVVGEEMCRSCLANDSIPRKCDDCAVEKAMRVGEPAEKVVTINNKAYRLIASPTKTSNGRHTIVMAIHADELDVVTKERDTLREHIDFLLHSAKIPLIFGNSDQRISYVSDEFVELFQVQKRSVATTADFWGVLVEKLDDPTVAVKICQAARIGGEQGECEISVTGKGNYRLLAIPAKSRDDRLIGVLVRFYKID